MRETAPTLFSPALRLFLSFTVRRVPIFVVYLPASFAHIIAVHEPWRCHPLQGKHLTLQRGELRLSSSSNTTLVLAGMDA